MAIKASVYIMVSILQRFLGLGILLFITQATQAQFTVNNSASAMDMAQELVGSGVEVLSATYTGHNQASGIFTAFNTTLPIEEGVVLSTGRVTDIDRAADDGYLGLDRASTAMGTPGNASLDGLINCNYCTYDAAILEFEFRAIGDSINFDFVFGSEEYPDYVCSDFNDVFGFFLSGPGITGEKNLALVPGTTVPVAINTINDDPWDPFGYCSGYGQGSPFPEYYIDNSGSTTIAFNGLTTTLTAKQEIQECEVYTIKLAIADVEDRFYDSGVFIKSSSFASEEPELSLEYEPKFPICPTDSVTFTAFLEGVNPPIDYYWLLNGHVVAEGVDEYTFTDLEEGDQIYLVVGADIDCSGTKLESELVIVEFLPPNKEELDVTICEGDSYTFNGETYTESIYGVTMLEPDPPDCDKLTILNLTVEPGEEPVFIDLGPFCQNDTPPDLPPTSEDDITGTWEPAVINTDIPGTTEYTFTPDGGQCAAEYIMVIEIEELIIPIFDQIEPLCQESNPVDLPETSNNNPGITGTWSPSSIDTDNPGISTYTFTPDVGQCADQATMDIEIITPDTPTFDDIGPLCQNDDAPPLPEISNDNPGIRGSWTPSSIDMGTSGTQTFTFHPDPDQCATEFIMDIEILPELTPTFDQLGPYCRGETPEDLPTSSLDDPEITGTWSPSIIVTDAVGSHKYTFTPDGEFCAEEYTMIIEIEAPETPEFNDIGPFCQGDIPPTLPDSSENGFTGSWEPSEISTETAGRHTYVFTPDEGLCAEEYTLEIEIEEPTIPTFDAVDPLCQDSDPIDLPTSSTNDPAITGTWSPEQIDTENPGTYSHTFIPDVGQCADSTTIDIEIAAPVTPTFEEIGPLCQNDKAPELPNISNDNPGIRGTWTPDRIDMSISGTQTFTFHPESDECAVEVDIEIEILPEISPIFDQLGPYCKDDIPDDLPTSSLNDPSISGSWSPSVIATDIPGVHKYTFTPDEEYCAEDYTMVIEIEAQEIPEFEDLGPYCLGETAADLPTSSENGLTGSWTPATISTDVPGSHNYTFTPDEEFCAESYTMTIQVDQPVTPTFNPIGPLCEGDAPVELPTISHDNPGISGDWFPEFIETDEPGTFIYTFTPKTGQCAETTTITVEISPLETPVFDQIEPLCQHDIAPELPEPNNNPPISGTWIPAVIDMSTSGTHTYTFQPDADECAIPVTMEIEILPELSLDFDQLGPYCRGDTPEELPSTPLNEPHITGTWSPSIISTEIVGTQEYIFTPDTEFCAEAYIMTIEIEESLTPMFQPIGPICQYTEGIELPATSDDYPAISGTWTPESINTESAGITTYTFTPDEGQCAEPTTIDIEIIAPTTPTFHPMGPFCLDVAPTVLPTTSTNNPPITGEWNPSVVNTSEPGIYEYHFTPTPNSCAEEITMEIEILDLPETSAEPVGPLCKDSAAVELIAEPEGGYWNGTHVNNGYFDPVAVGQFNAYYTYMDENGCINYADLNIIVEDCSCEDPASADAGPDGLICAGGVYTVSGSITVATEAIWTTSGSGIFDNPESLTTTYTPSQEDIDNGSVTLTLTTIDHDGDGPCSPVSDEMKLTIDDIIIEIQPVSPMCEDEDPVKLVATPNDGTWEGNGVEGNYFDPSKAGPGTHTVSLFLDNDCNGNESIEIIVHPTPDVSIEPIAVLCVGDDPVMLEGFPTGGSFSGHAVSGSTFMPDSEGEFVVEYHYTDENGCSAFAQMTIFVEDCDCQDPASADAGDDATICVGDSYTLDGSISNVDKATWTTSGTGTFDDAGSLNATYTPSQEDYDNRSVILTLTTDDPDGDGPCSPASDVMTLTFEEVEVIIDVVDPLCEDADAIELTASPQGGTWSGTGVEGNTFDPAEAGAGTHTVQYSIAGECPGSEEFIITVNPLPEIDIVPITDVCLDDPAIELKASPAGGTWSGDYVTNDEFNPSSVGRFTVTYSYTDQNGCSAEKSIEIEVEDCGCDNPARADAGDDATICMGDSYTLDGSISNVDKATWTTSGTGTFDDAGSLNATYTPSQEDYDNGSVILTLTTDDPDDDGPCSPASDVMTLTFEEVEVIIDVVDPLCEDADAIELTASPQGGTWSGTGVEGNTFDPAEAGTGTHTVRYSITGECPGSEELIITVNPLPEIDIVPITDVCLDDPAIELKASPSGGTWSGDYVSNDTFNPSSVGRFTVTYSYTDQNGCSAEKSIEIEVEDCGCDNPARADAGDDATICVGDSYTLDGSISNVDKATWTTSGTGTFDDAGSLNATYTPSQEDYDNGSVRLTLTTDDPDGDGPCSPASDAMTLTFEEVEVIIDVVDPLCEDADAIELTASPQGGTWSGTGVEGNTFDPAEAGAGTHTVQYSITGECPGSEELIITVNPLPEIDIVPITDVCLDDPAIELKASPAGGTWSGDYVTNDTFNPSSVGRFTVTYSYTDQNGCSAEKSIEIEVEDCGCDNPARADAGPDIEICVSETHTLNGSITNVDKATWTTSGTGTFDDAGSLNATYTPSQEDYDNGSVTLTLTTDDPDGDGLCEKAVDEMTLSFSTMTEVNLIIKDATCQNPYGSIQILPPASEMYRFSIDDGNTYTDTPEFGGLEPGNYRLIYKDPDSGCVSETGFTIKPAPTVRLNWDLTTQACSDAQSNYIDFLSTQNMEFPIDIYIDGDFYESISTLPARIDNLEIGNHNLLATDDNGCSVEDEFAITETSDISIDFQGVYVVDEGESIVLVPEINQEYTSILWSPPDYLSCTECHSPTARPEENMTYQVLVTNEQGCKDSADLRVVIRKSINVYVPNIFTPNNDGINDYITIFTDNRIEEIQSFKIFSRWGEMVFEKYDFPPNVDEEGWDGTFKGEHMNPDVFMWVAEIEIPGEGLRVFHGNVTLMR